MFMGLWFDKVYVIECWSISRRVEEIDRRLLNIFLLNCIFKVFRSIFKDYIYWKVFEFWLF